MMSSPTEVGSILHSVTHEVRESSGVRDTITLMQDLCLAHRQHKLTNIVWEHLAGG